MDIVGIYFPKTLIVRVRHESQFVEIYMIYVLYKNFDGAYAPVCPLIASYRVA